MNNGVDFTAFDTDDMRRGEGDEQKDDKQQSIKVYATISADATETNLI